MNFILTLIIIIASAGFALFYLVSALINLYRGLKMKKDMGTTHKSVDATVKIRKVEKQKIIIQVEYVSADNNITFNEYFQLPLKGNESKYNVGDKVTINYPDTSKLKKVYCFPISVDDNPLKMDVQSTIMDFVIFGAAVYIFVMNLISAITPEEVNGVSLIALQWRGRAFISSTASWGDGVNTAASTAAFSGIYLLIYIFFYFIFFTYVKDRLTGLNSAHKNQYLKLCGVKGKAEVVTYKFSKSKDEVGRKEAQMKIEFYTNTGDKINCDMSSYLYSETEEQFINILYDPSNPQNVVYLRENDSK